VGLGPDFEYRTSADEFLALQCEDCGTVYLSPRPAVEETKRIYPTTYHAFAFSRQNYGLAHLVRERIERARLSRVARSLQPGAAVLDVGCGDGFHLEILRNIGRNALSLTGLDLDERAVAAARERGLDVRLGTVQHAPFPPGSFDLALLIATIEHVADPSEVLAAVRGLLKPGGRILVITDNTDTLDFRINKGRYWGGYHFPRHWNLFDRRALSELARRNGLEVESIATTFSPVNWVYSIRNRLDDRGTPRGLVEFFSLKSPVALGVFTLWDLLNVAAGRGALLRAVLRRPRL
jgi:SAM-dependent methyltransferase